MRTVLTLLTATLFVVTLAAGTVSTANKRRTALYGPQLPNVTLVDAWNPDNATIVQNMRAYVRSLAR